MQAQRAAQNQLEAYDTFFILLELSHVAHAERSMKL